MIDDKQQEWTAEERAERDHLAMLCDIAILSSDNRLARNRNGAARRPRHDRPHSQSLAGQESLVNVTVIGLWGQRKGPYPLCPRCGCCTWEYVDADFMLCIGRCDEGGLHEEDRGDGEIDYGRFEPNPWPICPACLEQGHAGRVCPELTLTGVG